MKKNIFYCLSLCLLFSCQEVVDTVKENQTSDVSIVISADGMVDHIDKHDIKVTSFSLVDRKQEALKNMRIGALNVPVESEGRINTLSSSQYVNVSEYAKSKKLFGGSVDLSALLPTGKNLRISTDDFYNPELINLKVVQRNATQNAFLRTEDLTLTWNADQNNEKPVFVSIVCTSDEKGKESILIKKEVKDNGSLVISSQEFRDFYQGGTIIISAVRGNKEMLSIDGKKVSILAYSTSTKAALIVK